MRLGPHSLFKTMAPQSLFKTMACLNSYLPPYLCGGIYLFSVQVYPATAHHHTYLEVCITERGGHALSLFFRAFSVRAFQRGPLRYRVM